MQLIMYAAFRISDSVKAVIFKIVMKHCFVCGPSVILSERISSCVITIILLEKIWLMFWFCLIYVYLQGKVS
jgi:hypothetical protein